jgi:cephalosporin hydroxylase
MRGVLPEPVIADLNESLRDYWVKRAAQHTGDSYAGVGMSKFPEDLRVYEHLLWASRATAVIEIGAYLGGSALWFRDRLAAFGRYRPGPPICVVSIDIDVAPAQRNLSAADPDFADSITLIEAGVDDPSLVTRVADLLPPDARCLVVEDSAHVYETTFSSLTNFARFVPRGGYFVVEDGCVDVEAMRLSDDWPRGVLPALRDWLQTPEGRGFSVRRELELYGISCHPEGFLQRLPLERERKGS